MNFYKTNKYDPNFIKENLMGPNGVKMLEELTYSIEFDKDSRVLDLGCGKGLTSIFLAKEFGVQVFATDLWINPTENFNRFKLVDVENQIIPIHGDALELPYPDEYFDAVISVDSYHFFGAKAEYMDEKLAPHVKSGGIIGIAIPGLKEEFNNEIPQEMLKCWTPEDLSTIHSCQWWWEVLSKSESIKIESIEEMDGYNECWNDWLSTDNPYAKKDCVAMEAGAYKYMNHISIKARKN